jgi:hypothetical protein
VAWSPKPHEDYTNGDDAGILATKMAIQKRGWHTSIEAGSKESFRPASGRTENTPCIFNSFAELARKI